MILQPRTYEKLQESIRKYRELHLLLSFENQKLKNKIASLENQIQTMQGDKQKCTCQTPVKCDNCGEMVVKISSGEFCPICYC